jgi:hypothetical protein
MAKKIQNKDKKDAWESFSRWKRIKDCLEATGLPFVGICITCKPPRNKYHINYLQAGHCFSGRNNNRLIDEEYVFNQCTYCNLTMKGRPKRFRKKMVEKYGEKAVAKREIESKKVLKYVDWKEIKKKYDEKYINLMQQYGFKTWSELLQQRKN